MVSFATKMVLYLNRDFGCNLTIDPKPIFEFSFSKDPANKDWAII